MSSDIFYPPVFCAIDTSDGDRALALAALMVKAGCGVKLGLEFFNAQGPAGVIAVREEFPDLPIFLDLKLHDIPNTVASAVKSLLPLNVQYLTIHASGGSDMMQAAAEATGVSGPKLLAVTVLTSLDDDSLDEIGFAYPTEESVSRLARLAVEAGISGLICSPMEIRTLRRSLGGDIILMVPGIRPAGADTQDQKRVMTPVEAMDAGATHLVIGRPITRNANPLRAAQEIRDEVRKILRSEDRK